MATGLSTACIKVSHPVLQATYKIKLEPQYLCRRKRSQRVDLPVGFHLLHLFFLLKAGNDFYKRKQVNKAINKYLKVRV